MKTPLALAVVALTGVSAVARAQQPPGCPPGSWYCAESTDKPLAPAGQPVAPAGPPKAPSAVVNELPPLPGEPPVQTEPPAPPPAARPAPYPRAESQALPPPYPERPPPYAYRHRPHAWYRRNELGLNFNGQLAFLKTSDGLPTSMVGLGTALRLRPIPWIAFEGGLNIAAGRDYYAQRRTEVAGTITSVVFFNPQHRVQFYGVGGLLWAGASLRDAYDYEYASYSYFGGLVGAGLEARLSPHLAINGDYRVFLRTRTDAAAAYSPEFYNPVTGRTSNTSAAGYFNVGVTVYF